jgi:hypothetical protein
MKIITLKNEHGETIQVRHGIGGGIQVRHSDITGQEWADYFSKGEDMTEPGKAAFFADAGIDVKSPEFQKIHAALGAGHMVFNEKDCILDREEVAMIEEAIKRLD